MKFLLEFYFTTIFYCIFFMFCIIFIFQYILYSNTSKVFLLREQQKTNMDPRLDIFGQKSEFIKKVLREQKCWEEMPNRRELVTNEIIEEIQEICKDSDPDSLECALRDQNILGKYLSFCLSELAQNKENKKNFPFLAINGMLLAFTFKDFQFMSKRSRYLRQHFTRLLSNLVVESMKVKQCYQNMGNGQIITQIRNKTNPKFVEFQLQLDLEDVHRNSTLQIRKHQPYSRIVKGKQHISQII